MKRISLFLASMALMVGVAASVAWAADIQCGPSEADNPCLGTNQDDTLTGTSGEDFIFGLGGNDIISGLRY